MRRVVFARAARAHLVTFALVQNFPPHAVNNLDVCGTIVYAHGI